MKIKHILNIPGHSAPSTFYDACLGSMRFDRIADSACDSILKFGV